MHGLGHHANLGNAVKRSFSATNPSLSERRSPTSYWTPQCLAHLVALILGQPREHPPPLSSAMSPSRTWVGMRLANLC